MLGSAARHTCPRLGALRRKHDLAVQTGATPFNPLVHRCCLLCWQEGEEEEEEAQNGGLIDLFHLELYILRW